MSLADELLADLDDIEDEVEGEGEDAGQEDVMEAVAAMNSKGDRSVRSFAKLLDGEKVRQCSCVGGAGPEQAMVCELHHCAELPPASSCSSSQQWTKLTSSSRTHGKQKVCGGGKTLVCPICMQLLGVSCGCVLHSVSCGCLLLQ